MRNFIIIFFPSKKKQPTTESYKNKGLILPWNFLAS